MYVINHAVGTARLLVLREVVHRGQAQVRWSKLLHRNTARGPVS